LKFLGRARRFIQDLGAEPETKTQYFNVLCASGHRVRGERTEGYQALRCPACGEGVFVLPRSPLPEPAAPPRPTSARRGMGDAWVDEGPVQLTDPARVSVEVDAGESRADDAEIIWDDPPVETAPRTGRNHATGRAQKPDTASGEPASGSTAKPARPTTSGAAKPVPRDNSAPVAGPPPPGTPVRHRKKPQRATAAEGERSDTAQDGESRLPEGKRVRGARASQVTSRGGFATAADESELEPGPRRLSRKQLLHRTLLVVVPLLILSTVAWRYRQNRRAEYPVTAERGRTEGIPALEAGDFDKALRSLSEAKEAVEALGGAVEGADEIRNAALEAAIFVRLIPQTLEDLLAEAEPTDAWSSHFKMLYKGKSIIIQSWITAVPDSSPGSDYDIAYRVVPPGRPSNFVDGGGSRPDRVGRIDLNGFELLTGQRAGNQITFGAEIASFEFDGKSNEWVIRLVPNSGVYILHPKALEANYGRLGSEGEATSRVRP
jgi:hypothetical protein